jgi:type II restriction/modification system DNA methylase subunit YeeA
MWVADILYTIERAKFEKVIKDAVKARKERLEEKHNLNVEMRPEFAQALQNCMSFSSNAFLIL